MRVPSKMQAGWAGDDHVSTLCTYLGMVPTHSTYGLMGTVASCLPLSSFLLGRLGSMTDSALAAGRQKPSILDRCCWPWTLPTVQYPC